MGSLRAWQLTPSHPLALQIAADARLSTTDYLDDQTWEILLGAVDAPALVAQTSYGGRLGRSSILPMWQIDNRAVYQYQAYTTPPVVSAFAPGYLEILARITPRLSLRAEFWAADSHSLCVRYTLKNTVNSPIELTLNLVGFAASLGKEQKWQAANRLSGDHAITVGSLGRAVPLITLEGGIVALDSASAKLTKHITIKSGGSVTIRWVHTAENSLNSGFKHIDDLLKSNWTSAFRKINQHADPIPRIETGDTDTDATIAFAYQQLMQSFMDATMSMPYVSFVAARQPGQGYSRTGDGTDHPRSWSGQSPTLAYLTALATAPIDGVFAKSILRNFLALQQPDGWIDWKPGLAGQKSGMLCLPILARLAWEIYTITGDIKFLRESFPALAKFLSRWLRPDLDQDKDGLPEWSSEQQTGYPFMPTFAAGLGYGQQADIRTVEAPDLAAYLLSEAIHLQRIAETIGDTSLNDKLIGIIDTLKARLGQLWNGDRYTYQDRDTNTAHNGKVLLNGGNADEEHVLAEILGAPQRLVIHVIGGLERVPRLTLHIDGRGENGIQIHEQLETGAFTWASGRGAATTQHLFQQVDRIRAEGLSRVYKINVQTIDHLRRDISSVLPLWSRGISPERAAALITQVTDPAHFWMPNGVAMVSIQDNEFPTLKTGEGGGIWGYWVTLIGEGLLEQGSTQAAADLIKRVINLQAAVLKAQGAFSEFYHTSEPMGLGERGHTAGLVPLHLLHRVIGVQIVSKTRVHTGGAFAWGSDVTVSAHGVTVKRTPSGTYITFPSGNSFDLPPDAHFQTVEDRPNTTPSPPRTSDRLKESE